MKGNICLLHRGVRSSWIENIRSWKPCNGINDLDHD